MNASGQAGRGTGAVCGHGAVTAKPEARQDLARALRARAGAHSGVATLDVLPDDIAAAMESADVDVH
ncbi:hypothetical protein, partial [Streptomyces flavofungini]|uniref:hypothetical protein n=1 Tax=Streptomyces flavofungini TaxID=68200 RepID=UPI0034DDECCE